MHEQNQRTGHSGPARPLQSARARREQEQGDQEQQRQPADEEWDPGRPETD